MKRVSFELPKLRLFYLLLVLALAGPARAQFSTMASQTRFVCNAPGNQRGVQAFADGAGGSYTVWIDKRAGNNSGPGTALYVQHLNADGAPLLAANGVRLFQSAGRDIFGMRAVPWQSGLLVAWVQGAFGIGGDTVRCQYYSATGVAQWATPTVVANRTLPTVIYVIENGLNIIPTSTGATITYDVALNGGADVLSFNQVSPAGALRFANNFFQLPQPNSNVFTTIADGGDGFYAVTGSGGITSAIYAQHYDLNGNPWAAPVALSANGPDGRGGQAWRLVRDPSNNLYVVWGSSGGDVLAEKITPAGAKAWPAPGYVALCTNPSRQDFPDALWHNNALWTVWADDRPTTGFAAVYMQKADAAGTLAWAPAGVLVNDLPAVYVYPKLAPSDNGAVMAFYSTSYGMGFRAQKVRPDASLAFPVNGALLHNVQEDEPYVLDYAPVAQPNGSVQVYWSSPGAAPTGQDVCAGRMQNSGTLLSATERAAEALGFELYPNPATSEAQLRFPVGKRPTGLRLFDAQGRLVRAFAEGASTLPLQGLPVGLYVVRGRLVGQEISRRVVVE